MVGTVEARNFKFVADMDGSEFLREKNAKLDQKQSRGGNGTHFFNFGIPLISREWLKLETSNLARRRAPLSSDEKMQN